MPLNYTQRNITAGSQSPMVPLITNNPAFSVKIVALDGRMEQKPNQNNDGGKPNEVKIGDTVRGEQVSNTRKRGEPVIGRVLQIEMQENSPVSFKVITQRGKEVLLDPSTVQKIDVNREGPNAGLDTNMAMESVGPIMLYEQWKSHNQM